MAAKRNAIKKMYPASALRASVSFSPELYRSLEQMARLKKVSLAWVVRDAAEQYVVRTKQTRAVKGVD